MSESNRGRIVVELVGLGIVVVSLVFVGLEIRQNTAATQSATQQAVYEAGIESNMNVMNNDRLRELLVLTEDNAEWPDTARWDSDYLLLRRFYMNRFNNLENVYYHYIEGTYDPRLWGGQAGWIESLADQPLMRHFWSELRSGFGKEFRDYMDAAVSAGAPN